MESDSRYELKYCDDIENIEGNILKVPSSLLSALEKQEQIVVQGNAQDEFIFSTGDSTYRMRGIYLPTTMLVTSALGTGSKDDEQKSASKPSKPSAKILLQTGKYLKIQSHQIQFHRIFQEIQVLALGSNLAVPEINLDNILENQGISVGQLKYRYKIAQKDIEKIAKAAPIAFFKLVDDDEVLAVQLTYSFMAAVLRQLLPVLTAKGKLTSFFTYQQFSSSIPIISCKFLEVIARHFSFEVNPPLSPPSASCNQMQVEHQFKVTLDTILKFIAVELMLVKREYVKEEMDELMMNMLTVYLPIGQPDYSEEKAKEKMPDIVAQYFITVSKGGQHTLRIQYNPLTFNFNIKARVQEISSFKKKFTKAEIYGLFSSWYSEKEIDDILLKNFRKMGKQYEIKLTIPK